MTREEYYTAPSDKIFEDIKASAIFVWERLGREGGDEYEIKESIKRIQNMANIKDNCAYIVAMFDHENMFKLLDLVNPETRIWLEDVLRFGGIL